MEETIECIKDLFDSITCLCAEGPEFHTKMELMDLILERSMAGYDICKDMLE